MGVILLTNARLIDGTGAGPLEGAAVLVEGEVIREILPRWTGPPPGEAVVLDCRGQTLLPGLIDAHAHVTAVEADILEQRRRLAPSLIALRTARILEEALAQGFTTLRDAGGADWGLREAVARGIVAGPRLLVSGAPLTQTGGHGDFRLRAERVPSDPCLGMRTVIADGVNGVRWAVREELRQSADQIKVVAGGGVLSPGDPLEATQYSPAELRAAVEEAAAAGTYVAAHVYAPAGIMAALAAGVRSIEHGNLLDEASASALKAAGAFLVPTLATYELLWRHRREAGLRAESVAKLERARAGGLLAVELAHRMGCRIASGSDLLGPFQARRALELELKAEVMSPMEAICSATRVNAELLGLGDRLGTVEAGKWADLLVVDADPLRDVSALQRYRERLSLIMKGGVIHRNRLS